MKTRPRVSPLIFTVLTAFYGMFPESAKAAGLVPDQCENGAACTPCNLLELINNVSQWLSAVLIIVFIIVVVVSGLMLVTSGGSVAFKTKARKLITNALIGLILVLGAFIIIDTLMRFLLPDGTVNGALWSKSISCEDGLWEQVTPSTDGKYPVFSSGFSGGSPPDLSAPGACSFDLVSKYFASNEVSAAQCIIRDESTCGANSISTTDKLRYEGNRAFSFGPMQINLTVHELVGCGPGGSTLDCKAAFSGRNYTARIVNESLYQQCATAAQNFDCNLRNGKRIKNASGWHPTWSTAAGCGLR